MSKGQLAEAQITKYDSLGRPIGDNILISPDADGKGWFIDPTVFDPAAFDQTLSDTAFRASSSSDAYGHYASTDIPSWAKTAASPPTSLKLSSSPKVPSQRLS